MATALLRLILSVACFGAAPAPKTDASQVPALPTWWKTGVVDQQSLVKLGDVVRRTLKPKGGETPAEIRGMLRGASAKREARHQTATLRVERDQPIEVRLDAKQGVPALMVVADDAGSADPLAWLVQEHELPGRPVAFALGALGAPALLQMAPAERGVLQIVFWVLRGPLQPVRAARPPDPSSDPGARASELMGREAFVRAWAGKDYDRRQSSPDWVETVATLSLRPGPAGSPRSRDLVQELLEKAGVRLGELMTETQRRRAEVTGRLEALERQRESVLGAWARRGVRRDLADAHGVFRTRLELWTRHPAVVAALTSAERRYQGWSPEQVQASVVFAEARGAEAEFEVLGSKATDALTRLLASLGGADGVLVDRRGLVIAAAKPGFRLSLRDDEAWAALEQHQAKQLLISPPQPVAGRGWQSRRVAAPVRDTEGALLGWALVDVYVAPVGR